MAEHIVRIQHDPESHACAEDCHDDCTADVLCLGVTDACRLWNECDRCRKVLQRLTAEQAEEYDERLDDREEAHGVEHQRVDGYWMTPSAKCLSQGREEDDAPDLIPHLPDGDYPVSIDWDEGYLTVALVPSQPATDGGADRG